MNPKYWEMRYRTGGTSGPGSRGAEAAWKVELVNRLLAQVGARSVLDLGSGDGFLRSLGLASAFPYLGIEPSATARKIAAGRPARIPSTYLEAIPELERRDVALSLDVIFHQTTEAAYRGHLADLFGHAERFVIVYGTDYPLRGAPHVLHRNWTPDIPEGWAIAEQHGHNKFKTAWLLERMR